MKFKLRCIETTKYQTTFRLYAVSDQKYDDYSCGVLTVKNEDLLSFIGEFWKHEVAWDGRIPEAVEKLAIDAWAKGEKREDKN